jgi:hypothetical protein
MKRIILLLALVTLAHGADMAMSAQDSAQNGRARIVALLTSNPARTATITDAASALVTKWSLCGIDPATFGFLSNATGDNMVSVTAGANVLTSPSARWVASDAGRAIDIAGAGVAGVTLRTTIAGFTNAGRVTITANASTTVAATKTSAGGLAIWGDDAPLALRAAPTITDATGTIVYQPQALDLTSLSGALVTATGATSARTLANSGADMVNVLNYGATGDGVTDDGKAFNSATIAAINGRGELFIPGGTYMLSTQWTITHNVPKNITVHGYGAELFTGAGVDSALLVTGGYTPHGVRVLGVKVNHRGNAVPSAGIEAKRATHFLARDVVVEAHGTQAGYAGIKLNTGLDGDPNYCSFWSTIENCAFRKRGGGDVGDPDYSILLRGACNATVIRGCSFQIGNVAAIGISTDGTEPSLANGVFIENNHFEGVVTSVAIAGAAGGYTPPGLRVVNNRVESCTNFVTCSGCTADSNNGPILANNYLTVGSVTNYLVNPSGRFFVVSEPSYKRF